MKSRIERTARLVMEEQPQPFIGQVVGESDGGFSVTVNGRDTPRDATATNEFASASQGSLKGSNVLVIAGGDKDQPVIIGASPWLI